MIRTILVPTLLLIALSACSRQIANPPIPIAYPATPAGDALRDFYTTTERDPEKFHALYARLDDLRDDEAVKDALKPTMLAILRQDDSVRALWIAYILAEWYESLPATAPEFRRLLPALAKGLENPNNDDSWGIEWPAIASAKILSQMGPVAIRPVQDAIAKRFLAPAPPNNTPIYGESNEGWTRYITGHILAVIDETSVAALTKGLDHKDPLVRYCAVDCIGFIVDPNKIRFSDEEYLADRLGWRLSSEHKSALQHAARKQAAKVAERLWDDDKELDGLVRKQALRTLPHLMTSKEVTPRVRQRLLELLKYHQSAATEALQAFNIPIPPDSAP
ncbi:MAG: hypothetical protein FWD53_06555 [Phycisphaerales bacterium]|nr:hypothetical protein [Phycisphaerales bacterium]